MYFSDNILQQIKDRIKISEIVAKKIKLTRKGADLWGLCPFHHEKTSSFTVNDDKQYYHCFGCGAHGDVIKFVTETSGFSFKEVVEQFAGQIGITLARGEFQKENHRDLYHLMDLSRKWFTAQLKSSKGRDAMSYLINRKVNMELIDNFSLGFAPNEKKSLMDYLLKQGATLQNILDVGLIIKSDSGDYFDRFRARVMFPIINSSGKVLAFGGRSMNKAIEPKYLNSPETVIFKKREVLFGENFVREPSHKKKRIIVVEGYMDVISMHNAGFNETVASLGTAITKEHLARFWKYANRPIICLDGDEAGMRAMNKLSIEAVSLLKEDCSLDFIKLPSGSDPDELTKNQNSEVMDRLIEHKISLSEFIWQAKFASMPSNATPEQKSSLEKYLYSLADTIEDKTIKSAYRSFFADKLWYNVKKHKNRSLLKDNKSTINSLFSIDNCRVSDIEKIERTLLIIIMSCPELLNDHDIEEDFSRIDFSNHDLGILRSNILSIYYENSEINKQELALTLGDDNLYLDINQWAKSNIPFVGDDANASWHYSCSKYRILILEEEYKIRLEELTESSDIKAQEIRKQIIFQRNKMLEIEQLLDR